MTGFGKLAKTQVDVADLSTLQHNLIRSHAAGVGEPLAPRIVRLAMILKLLSLARGYSGVRPQVIEHFISMLSENGLEIDSPSMGTRHVLNGALARHCIHRHPETYRLDTINNCAPRNVV